MISSGFCVMVRDKTQNYWGSINDMFFIIAGPYTVFAPYDLAFNLLPDAIYNELMNNQTNLKRMLMYHIVKGAFYLFDPPYGHGASNEQLLPSLIPGKDVRLNIYQVGFTVGRNFYMTFLIFKL